MPSFADLSNEILLLICEACEAMAGSLYGIVLTSRQLHTLAKPLLYKTVDLSHRHGSVGHRHFDRIASFRSIVLNQKELAAFVTRLFLTVAQDTRVTHGERETTDPPEREPIPAFKLDPPENIRILLDCLPNLRVLLLDVRNEEGWQDDKTTMYCYNRVTVWGPLYDQIPRLCNVRVLHLTVGRLCETWFTLPSLVHLYIGLGCWVQDTFDESILAQSRISKITMETEVTVLSPCDAMTPVKSFKALPELTSITLYISNQLQEHHTGDVVDYATEGCSFGNLQRELADAAMAQRLEHFEIRSLDRPEYLTDLSPFDNFGDFTALESLVIPQCSLEAANRHDWPEFPVSLKTLSLLYPKPSAGEPHQTVLYAGTGVKVVVTEDTYGFSHTWHSLLQQ
ncbi:hypothetical protein EJ04DRAFT_570874 [Polyplosphaeria fusca]|uniref:Uncharacterized protein n=1 Tax=Polyplosphaeria fusca TaxID=682080 RepID=A0A9P4UW84_9PLEO|nr:hypothetical protein EJ04DRAFT_570874 [Polyplosphaeria fusca]